MHKNQNLNLTNKTFIDMTTLLRYRASEKIIHPNSTVVILQIDPRIKLQKNQQHLKRLEFTKHYINQLLKNRSFIEN